MTEPKKRGRPRSGDRPKEHTGIRIDPDVLAFLRQTGLSPTIEQITKRTQAFREWRKNNVDRTK